MLGFDHVMQPVRLHHALHVTPLRVPAVLHAAVHQDIVQEEIDGAIHGDARSDRGDHVQAIMGADHQQDHRRDGARHAKPVVAFKLAGARFVMGFVQYPQKPVHHIFVGDDGHHLHDSHHEQRDADALPPIHIGKHGVAGGEQSQIIKHGFML